jgi:hypothetical protein
MMGLKTHPPRVFGPIKGQRNTLKDTFKFLVTGSAQATLFKAQNVWVAA